MHGTTPEAAMGEAQRAYRELMVAITKEILFCTHSHLELTEYVHTGNVLSDVAKAW
jgi:hypothetical protein